MLGTSAHLPPVGRSLSLQEKTKSTRLLSTPMEQFCTQLLGTLSECGTLESKNQILISQPVVLKCGNVWLSVNSRWRWFKLVISAFQHSIKTNSLLFALFLYLKRIFKILGQKKFVSRLTFLKGAHQKSKKICSIRFVYFYLSKRWSIVIVLT